MSPMVMWSASEGCGFALALGGCVVCIICDAGLSWGCLGGGGLRLRLRETYYTCKEGRKVVAKENTGGGICEVSCYYRRKGFCAFACVARFAPSHLGRTTSRFVLNNMMCERLSGWLAFVITGGNCMNVFTLCDDDASLYRSNMEGGRATLLFGFLYKMRGI